MDQLSDAKRVYRSGDAVVRPGRPWSSTVHALLRHLEAAGFDGSPWVVGTGFDAEGRETLGFVDGDVLPRHVWSDDGITELGHLFARLHRATASFVPPGDAVWQPSFLRHHGPDAIISHGDAAVWNVVGRRGLPVALIDWELAGPVDRLSELAHTAWLNAGLFDDALAEEQGLPPIGERIRKLRLFADGYGLGKTDRAAVVGRLVDVAVLSCAADIDEAEIGQDTIGQPANLWGVVWRGRSAAWLVRNRSRCLAAMA